MNVKIKWKKYKNIRSNFASLPHASIYVWFHSPRSQLIFNSLVSCTLLIFIDALNLINMKMKKAKLVRVIFPNFMEVEKTGNYVRVKTYCMINIKIMFSPLK
jgi:hypothetical protein